MNDVYAFFRATEGMLGNLVRDLPASPALQQAAKPFFDYWTRAQRVLEQGWGLRGRRRTLHRAAIGHALEFETWRSLTSRQGLTDRAATELMVGQARAARA